MNASRELFVQVHGAVMGAVTETDTGAHTFRYDPSWRDRIDAFPLSLSIPLTREYHDGPEVRAYLEGLLPDNPEVRRKWGIRFGVSPRNPFGLLTHMGMDCPGAVRFVRGDRLEEAQAEQGPTPADEVEWLTEGEVAEILRDAAQGQGTGRLGDSVGYFSLAGAQPKTALLERDGRWGVPGGGIPTTHILKPPADDRLPGFEVNEHYCLTLARAVGLAAAESRVATFQGERALVVKRFDRRPGPEGIPRRIHQEDLCQALGVHPDRKYEAEGGPGIREILGLIRRESDRPDADAEAFLRAAALAWVIGASDAHAKNYAFFLEPAGSVRLAPLFDLASILPYPRVARPQEVRLAMRIGREYRLQRIGQRQWAGLAEMCGLDPDGVLETVREVVRAIPEGNEEACRRLRDEGLEGPVLQMLREAVARRAVECLEAV